MSVKESNNSQRTLESQLLTFQSKDPSKDFRIKELEGSKRALEQECELLRKKVSKRRVKMNVGMKQTFQQPFFSPFVMYSTQHLWIKTIHQSGPKTIEQQF